jgi:ADP-ribose pyrophosphatase
MMSEDILPATSHVVFQTSWFSVHEEYFSGSDHLQNKPYYRIHGGDGVVVLALNNEQQVVLVRQYRPTIRRYTLEIPAGGIEPGETPEKAAHRELEEEVGVRVGRLVYLGHGFNAVDRLDTRLHAFLALDVEPIPGHHQMAQTEKLVLPWSEFRALVREGKFHQIAGLGIVLVAAWQKGLDLESGRVILPS